MQKTIVNFIFSLFVCSVLFFIQACGRSLEPERSCHFVQNSEMQRVSWELQGRPIELYLDNSVPGEYITGIKTGVDKWNEIGERYFKHPFFHLNYTSPGSATPARDGYVKIYNMMTWESAKRNEQARTTLYWSGSRAYEADIRLNDFNFDFFTGDDPDFSKVHLESLIIHELGHVLGLAHTDADDSVMQVSLANGKLRENLGHFEVDSLKCEY